MEHQNGVQKRKRLSRTNKKKSQLKRKSRKTNKIIKPCHVLVKRLSDVDKVKFNCRDPLINERKPVPSHTYNYCDLIFQDLTKECNRETLNVPESTKKSPIIIYYNMLKRLKSGAKVYEIDFEEYVQCTVKRNEFLANELERIEGLHHLLQTTIYNAIFDKSKKLKSPVIEDVKEFIKKGIPLDGSESKQVMSLVTIIRAHNLTAKNSMEHSLTAKNSMEFCFRNLELLQSKPKTYYMEVPRKHGKILMQEVNGVYYPVIEVVIVDSELYANHRYCTDCEVYFLEDEDIYSHHCARKRADGYQCIYCEKLLRYRQLYKHHVERHAIVYEENGKKFKMW